MKFTTHLFALLLTLATALAVRAQSTTTVTMPITVPDGSFESSYGSTNENPNIASGWIFAVNPGDYYGVLSISSGYSSEGAASGSNYAYLINDNPGITETITSAASLGTITADTTYTLSLAVGNPSAQDTELYGQPGPVSFSLLANGQAFATQTVPNGSVANGTFDDFSLTYTTPDSGSVIGENLTIQLASLPEHGTAYVPGFDNVQLEETTIEDVPEPSTLLLLGVAGIALWWLMSHRTRRSGLPGRSISVQVAACFALGFVAAGIAPAFADPVEVPDNSFETGGGWTYSDPDIIPGWIFNAPTGSSYGSLFQGACFTTPDASEGNQFAYIDNDVAGTEASLNSASTLGTITADTTYTLTVALGSPDAVFQGGPLDFDPVSGVAPAGAWLALLANGQPFAIDPVPAGLVASGTWQDFSLTYTTTDADPIVGEQLTIQLGTDLNPGEASFDNLRLDASASDIISGGGDEDGSGDPGTAPEPPSYGLLGLGLAALGWLSRWQRFQRDCLC